MKFEGINEVLYGEAYEQLLSRYSGESEDFMQPCAKKRGSGAQQPKKPGGTKSGGGAPKSKAPAQPKKPSAPKKPKKPNPCAPEAKKSNDTTFSEEFDFMLCQRPDGSYYGTAGVCRKGVQTTREEAVKAIESSTGKPLSAAQKEALSKLSDSDLAKVQGLISDKESFVRKAAKDDELSDAEVAKRVKALNDFEKKYGAEGMERLGESMASMSQAGSEDYRYKKTPREEEIKAIQDDKGRADKLIKGFDNAASLQKGGENAVIKFRNVSDEEVDLAWSLSSKGTQNSFKSAGTVPNKDAWKGLDKEGNNTYGSNSVDRGKMLMKRWMEQGGVDGYSGRPLTLNNADLEHIVPFSKAGRDAEQPSNWLWISRGLNTSKGNKSMDEFVGGVRKLDAAAEGRAHSQAVAKATQAGGKADLKAKSKESGFISRLEVAANRNQIVDVYAKAGLTRYIASPLGAQKIPGHPEADKIKFVDKTGPNRGQVKQLLQTQANWREGKSGSGRMTASEWIARNYPGMSPSQKAQFKSLFNKARTEADTAKAAGEKATGGTFTQRLADLTAEAFAGQDY